MLNVDGFCAEVVNERDDQSIENEAGYRLEQLEKLWDRAYDKRYTTVKMVHCK